MSPFATFLVRGSMLSLVIAQGCYVPPHHAQGASQKAPPQLRNGLLIAIYCDRCLGGPWFYPKAGMGGRRLHHDEGFHRCDHVREELDASVDVR